MNHGGLVAVLERVVGREQPAVELIASIVQRGGSGEKRRRCSVSRQASVLATGYHVLSSEAAEKPARSGFTPCNDRRLTATLGLPRGHAESAAFAQGFLDEPRLA